MTHNAIIVKAVYEKNVSDYFNALFADNTRVSQGLPYNADWENGTGYMDGLEDDPLPTMQFGEVARTTTPKGRRILVVKTRLGNVTVFERYVPQANGKLTGPIVINCATPLHRGGLVGNEGSQSVDQLVHIFDDGTWPNNVGKRLESITRDLAKMQIGLAV